MSSETPSATGPRQPSSVATTDSACSKVPWPKTSSSIDGVRTAREIDAQNVPLPSGDHEARTLGCRSDPLNSLWIAWTPKPSARSVSGTVQVSETNARKLFWRI